MTALRAGIFVTDAITLEEVTPLCESLEALGVEVTVIVPSGGSRLPVTGRFYPAAGGRNLRRALSQLSSADLDLLVLPARITAAHLAQHPRVLALARGRAGEGMAMPVFTEAYLGRLLARGVTLAKLARKVETRTAGSARRR